jgi:hypothetical protein
MNFEEHKRAMKRLRRLGVDGYVVLSQEAARSGLGGFNFPIGTIVGFEYPITVRVRKLGQRTVRGYAAGFWQAAPNRLISYIRFRGL